MALLPNFLVIGAAKAGTTTLYDTLRQHPQVFLAWDKEPAFFSDDEAYARGEAWYRETYFAGGEASAARGEATSTYLHWSDKVVPRLRHVYGDRLPRIIAIFRDPVALVWSFYWFSVREGREPLSFRAALDAEAARMATDGAELARRGRIAFRYREIARYATHLAPYLAHVPPERRLFLLTDDFSRFDDLVRTLEQFLEIDHAPTLAPVASNRAALPRSRRLHQAFRQRSAWKDALKPLLPAALRHRLKAAAIEANMRAFRPPPIDPELAAGLRRHYADEMRRLEPIIGRDLSAWYAR